MQHRDNENYKKLFIKIGLNYDVGKSMDPDLWEIAHLYRVLVCRKVGNGKTLNQYNLDERLKAYKGKEIPRASQDDRRGQSGNRGGHSYSRGKPHHNNYNNHSRSGSHRN